MGIEVMVIDVRFTSYGTNENYSTQQSLFTQHTNSDIKGTVTNTVLNSVDTYITLSGVQPKMFGVHYWALQESPTQTTTDVSTNLQTLVGEKKVSQKCPFPGAGGSTKTIENSESY